MTAAILFGLHHGNITVDWAGALVLTALVFVAMGFAGRS